MDKTDSEETFQMPSTPLKQMYHRRKYMQYISSLAPADMDLDHEDPPLALDNWSLQSYFYAICPTTAHRQYDPKTKP